MQSTSAAMSDQNGVTLGCFEVDGRIYAIDISQIREVIRWQPATPLPKAPALIEGVIDLRGVVVPVMDLSRSLGGERVETGPRTRIAITEVDGLVVGLIVDSAVEVLAVEPSALEDPPLLATQAGYDAMRAVVRRPDAEPILVLSLEYLIESVYRSVLPAKEAPA